MSGSSTPVPPSQLPPVPFQDRHGRERRSGFIFDRPIVCAAGHRVKRYAIFLPGPGVMECIHGLGKSGGMCGLMVWLFQLSNGWHWAADIDLDDIRYMERHQMDPVEQMAYLGGAFPDTARALPAETPARYTDRNTTRSAG